MQCRTVLCVASKLWVSGAEDADETWLRGDQIIGLKAIRPSVGSKPSIWRVRAVLAATSRDGEHVIHPLWSSTTGGLTGFIVYDLAQLLAQHGDDPAGGVIEINTDEDARKMAAEEPNSYPSLRSALVSYQPFRSPR